MIGTPFLENATVLATATKQGRGKKLIVFRYKPKKRIRHRRGHRQELTILTIDDIVTDGKSLITGEAPKSREEEEEELPAMVEAETPAESTEVEAATGEVSETTESDGEERRLSRRRRTKRTEESESEAEE
jgi:large subunit ribosomal protein L21